MGVCGYTYSEVQDMPIDALSRAINAKKAHDFAPWKSLFAAFFGAPESEPTRKSGRPLTPELFKGLFGVKT